ncbi:MAG: hypothetical protein ACI8UP_005488, partial [Porticoccaceae bacterium]
DTKDELKAEFDEQLKADKSSDSQLANESAVDKNKDKGD